MELGPKMSEGARTASCKHLMTSSEIEQPDISTDGCLGARLPEESRTCADDVVFPIRAQSAVCFGRLSNQRIYLQEVV